MQDFTIRGGVRIIPKLGSGFRVDDGWPWAKVTVTTALITIRHWWAGTLVATPDTIAAIAPWRGIMNHGVLFDVTDLDEIWIFQTSQYPRLLDQLAQMGWPVQDTVTKWSDRP